MATPSWIKIVHVHQVFGSTIRAAGIVSSRAGASLPGTFLSHDSTLVARIHYLIKQCATEKDLVNTY